MDINTAELAGLLLTVGMSSVIAVLGLVALSSRVLIVVTNRLAATDGIAAANHGDPKRGLDDAPDETELAVVIAAAQAVAGSGGVIREIHRVDGQKEN